MNRRRFLAMAAASSTMTLPGALSGASRLPIRKAILITMLPADLSLADGMKLAKDVGFEEIECQTVSDPKQAEAIKIAAGNAGLRIHSVMNMAHWSFPLNASDPEIVKKGMDGMETSLRNAHLWGADTVLLVPAVVNPKFSYYQDAWMRSQQQIRKLLPLAEELKVVIAIEEVWNKFLVSPTEFARYVDEFQSAWVRAYLDVGNMVFYGYPQDWIRIMGKRIAKLHIKDFRYRKGQTEWVGLREGDIDWLEVYKALADIGYQGTATVELDGGDAAYLREVSRRFDLILSGVKA
jgi:L-ribulose-5-phosphate 3-epimerase